MWHVGIDLHRATVVLAAVNDVGDAMNPITIPCADTTTIVSTVNALGAFRAVIEVTGTYRWLYDVLRPYGTVLLAHSTRLRAMIQRRTKTDKLDAQLLANLLRINQIPLAFIPPEPYQQLRDLTRSRARLGRHLAEVKIQRHDGRTGVGRRQPGARAGHYCPSRQRRFRLARLRAASPSDTGSAARPVTLGYLPHERLLLFRLRLN
jgi:transposase